MQRKNTYLVIVMALVFIPILFWLIKSPIIPRFGNPTIIFRSLGQIFALTGVTLFAVNLLIASRIKLVDKIFGGLNFAYKKHHKIGEIAFVLILWHPLTLLISNFLITPQLAYQFLISFWGEWGLMFGKMALGGMATLLILTLYIRLKYHIWKFSHKFLGIVYMLVVVHFTLMGSDILSFLPLGIFIYSLSAAVLASVLYRVIFPSLLVKKFKYLISGVNILNEGVFELALYPQEKKIKYIPGQFVYLTIPSVNSEEHPFTLSSSPSEKELSLLIKKLGDYTEILDNLKKGDEIKIEGPFGTFSHTLYPKSDQLWVSGGIGIAPFISMIKHIKNHGFKKDIVFIHSVGSKNEMIYENLINKVFSKKNLKFVLFESSKNGHLDFAQIKKLVSDVNSRQIFICGPKAMNRGLKQQLLDNSIHFDNIHIEDFEL